MLAPHSLSAAHLKAIGLVAAEWSYTETALESLIWQVATLDHLRGYAMTTHVQSETRLNILATLADNFISDQAHKKEIAAVIAEVRRLRTDRNNIVHSIWMSSKPPQLFSHRLADVLKKKKGGRRPLPNLIKVTAKGRLSITQVPYPSKKILATANEIGTLVLRMYRLLEALQVPQRQGRALVAAALAESAPAPDPDPATTAPQ